jgi:uncharacterized protein (DUF4415 family)
MPTKKPGGERPWVDPDDAPELTDEYFARADVYRGEKLMRRGRPPLERPKIAVKLRLSQEVVEGFRATGPGWQTRINAALEDVVRKGPHHRDPSIRKTANGPATPKPKRARREK